MGTSPASGSLTFGAGGFRSLFDTGYNIKIRVLTIVALAAAVGNTLGFLANLILYGFNFVTAFCCLCAALIVLNLFFGLRSRYGIALGYAMLGILVILEFPLLALTYGAIMYPYFIIGFLGLLMSTEKRKRILLCSLLGLYDAVLVAYSCYRPYLFGPQDQAALLGSAVVTFVISLCTVASLVIMWQDVYLVETLEIDSITKVQSQTGFYKNAAKILRSEPHAEFVLLYFNVLSFKAINSIFGIDGGNRFLRAVAERLTRAPFSPRLVGRLNSDRFVCLAEKRNFNEQDLEEVCRMSFEEKGRGITAQLNCGIYEVRDRTIPVSSMSDRACAALRWIHASGSHFYALYDGKAEASFREETEVLGEIGNAIRERQFIPYYQPIVDSETGRIVSAEALARWNHPELGLISPGVFIPVLEKKDLVSDLDRIIAEGVSQCIQTRLGQGKKIVPVSVNLSRTDLYDRELMLRLHRMLQDTEEPWYRFEITESAYEDMSDYTIQTISELRKRGALILVDDFGSGYSSLGMITDYEFDIIKLDMQFASKIDGNERIRGVVQNLVGMAHKLGAKVVAEGVETEAQFQAVRECGCDYVQGYYFYRPLPQKEFLELLDKEN